MSGCNRHGLADTVLPYGWFETSIGAHFEFKNGLNKAKKFFGHGTPIVNYMDVYRHSWLLPSHVSGKVDVTKNERQAYSARQHDAFFTRTSETVDEIGMCAVLMEPIENAVFSGFVLRARPLNDKLSSSFAAYALRGREVRQQIEAAATYTTRALTNGKSLSAVIFALPPPKEQERIGAALKDIDDLIASLDALIAKKRDIKQAAMQQLLTGKTRLPRFNNKAGKLVETAVGTIPSDWSVVRVRDGLVASPCYGINAPSVPFSFSLPTYLRITDIEDDGQLCADSLTSVNHPASDQYPLDVGDIVIARTGASTGKAYLHNKPALRFVYAGFLIRLRPNKSVFVPEFLSAVLRTSRYWAWIREVSQRSGQPGVNAQQLSGLLIPLPSPDEQSEIVSVLESMDAEILALDGKLKKFSAMKNGMMQQLLTGRIRLA